MPARSTVLGTRSPGPRERLFSPKDPFQPLQGDAPSGRTLARPRVNCPRSAAPAGGAGPSVVRASRGGSGFSWPGDPSVICVPLLCAELTVAARVGLSRAAGPGGRPTATLCDPGCRAICHHLLSRLQRREWLSHGHKWPGSSTVFWVPQKSRRTAGQELLFLCLWVEGEEAVTGVLEMDWVLSQHGCSTALE